MGEASILRINGQPNWFSKERFQTFKSIQQAVCKDEQKDSKVRKLKQKISLFTDFQKSNLRKFLNGVFLN